MLHRSSSPPRAPVLLLLLALAGCATPESRVRHGLIEAGLTPDMAQCMAKPMAHRLSSAQLARLGELGQSLRQNPGDQSINRVVHELRALGDPKIVSVTMTSALRCAALPAP